MKGVILQPTYLPWMGYFDMIDQSDIFIIADNAQFVRSSWQMRNRIKVPTGFSWLIVPVKRDPIVTPINKVRISYDRADPLKKHWETISVFYKKSKFLNDYANKFHTIFTKNYVYLKDLNVDLIFTICEILGIKNKDIIFLSNLDIEDGLERTERVIRICKATGITDWIEGKLGETKSLFDVKKINERGISVEFHEYQHPEYTQLFGDFIPYLSVVDLILNHGPDSLSIIRSGRKF